MESSIVEYIKAGVLFSKTSKQFITLAMGPLILVIVIGLGPGLILKNEFLVLSMIMVVTSVAFLFSVFFCSRGKLNIKKRLILQSLIYLDFVLQFQLLIIVFFIMWKGFGWQLVLICLPTILLPVFIGGRNTNLIKNGTYSNTTQKSGSITFAWTGVAGALIAKIFFDNITQDLALLIVILSFFVINCFLSIGLLSIHRLYYFYKLEQKGILID